jgi:hypothetical protein
VNETRRVERLRADHPIESFDCGKEELNRYLLLSCDETAGDRLSIYAAHQRGYSLRNAATGLTFVARRAGT